jgi:drug/metabolite transporter (DMT)-like permease
MSPLLLGVLFLALSVVATSAFSLIMRYSQEKGYSVLAVGGVNYLAATALAACLPGARQLDHVSAGLWLLAAASGLGFLLTYMLLTPAMLRHGVTVPTAAVQTAMVVPVVVAAWLWHERMHPAQVLGVLAGVAAIVLLAPARENGRERVAIWAYLLIPTIFALSGASRLAQKAIAVFAPHGQQAALALIWFAAAAVSSVVMLARIGWPRRWGEWLAGAALGFVNLACLVFLLRTLSLLPAAIVFPVVSCLSLMLVSAGGFVWWGERLTRRGGLGLVAGLLAVVLVSVR